MQWLVNCICNLVFININNLFLENNSFKSHPTDCNRGIWAIPSLESEQSFNDEINNHEPANSQLAGIISSEEREPSTSSQCQNHWNLNFGHNLLENLKKYHKDISVMNIMKQQNYKFTLPPVSASDMIL